MCWPGVGKYGVGWTQWWSFTNRDGRQRDMLGREWGKGTFKAPDGCTYTKDGVKGVVLPTCNGQMPRNLNEKTTQLLAIDARGTVYRWKFNPGCATSKHVYVKTFAMHVFHCCIHWNTQIDFSLTVCLSLSVSRALCLCLSLCLVVSRSLSQSLSQPQSLPLSVSLHQLHASSPCPPPVFLKHALMRGCAACPHMVTTMTLWPMYGQVQRVHQGLGRFQRPTPQRLPVRVLVTLVAVLTAPTILLTWFGCARISTNPPP